MISAILAMRELKSMLFDMIVGLLGPGCAAIVLFLLTIAGIALFIGVMMTN